MFLCSITIADPLWFTIQFRCRPSIRRGNDDAAMLIHFLLQERILTLNEELISV